MPLLLVNRTGIRYGESSKMQQPPQHTSTKLEWSHDNHPWRLELPTFNCENLWGWITKVECYFQMDGIDENERLPGVILCFKGEALS